ncbi:copper amine oxidase N-terminal domain-containing protein [Brevibacillus daliensis]|uniref:copper amine oxidase N-terminal domain-containing protein n=1 Tax=Brevibacillus daliensis TaxID=2892995 RepID=UPI001E375202|nr:copper amine oxidase N-terminal domain-containing protein [Brevibacillus daliensis]
MKKQVKQSAFLLLATTLALTPVFSMPQSTYAASDLNISADDYRTEEETEYTLEFTIDKKMKEGDDIIITFDEEFDLSEVTKKDVDADFDIDTVSINTKKNKITITIGDDIDKDDVVEITIDNVINPDDKGKYEISVEDAKGSEYEKVTIDNKKSSSSSSSKNEKDAFKVVTNSDKTSEKTKFDLDKFTTSTKLSKSDTITVTFPSSDMLPSSIKTKDVILNGDEPADVTISGKTVKLKVSKDQEGDKYIEIEFAKDAGIKNPSSSGDYKIEVDFDKNTYISKSFEVKKGSSNVDSNYGVNLSDSRTGARTTVTMEVALDSNLESNQEFVVEFPTQDMIPGFIFNSHVTINGSASKNVYVAGNKVYISTPNNFSSTKNARINFANDAFIKSPGSAGSYNLNVVHKNTTYKSASFNVTGSSVVDPGNPGQVTPPVTPPVTTPANNSAATVSLSKPNPNSFTAVTLGIKALGAQLNTTDFIEVVMPSNFVVPSTIANTNVTLNGVYARAVVVRGKNLAIYPSAPIAAGQAVNVVIGEGAKVQTPGASNIYSVGVYTSEEQNPLFIRQVTVGAQNGISFKTGQASYKTQGKTYPLAVAPYTLNSNTMVPATFVRDGLKVNTTYTKTSATVKHGNNTMVFTVGSNIVKINGKNYTLPVAVQQKNNIPMLPLRNITDTLRFNLAWDNSTSSVIIFK